MSFTTFTNVRFVLLHLQKVADSGYFLTYKIVNRVIHFVSRVCLDSSHHTYKATACIASRESFLTELEQVLRELAEVTRLSIPWRNARLSTVELFNELVNFGLSMADSLLLNQLWPLCMGQFVAEMQRLQEWNVGRPVHVERQDFSMEYFVCLPQVVRIQPLLECELVQIQVLQTEGTSDFNPVYWKVELRCHIVTVHVSWAALWRRQKATSMLAEYFVADAISDVGMLRRNISTDKQCWPPVALDLELANELGASLSEVSVIKKGLLTIYAYCLYFLAQCATSYALS